MSTQVTVRLPDDLVAYADAKIERHEVKSRAEFIARIMDRERRRERAEQDLIILLKEGDYPELDGITDCAARVSLDDLD